MKDFAFYLPDGGISEIWGIAVTACGLVRTAPGVPYPPEPGRHPGDHLFHLPKGGRILDCYQLLYISSGSGHFESTATGKVSITGGTAILLFSEVWHRYAPDPGIGWTEYYVELRGPTLDLLRERGVIRPKDAVFPVASDEALTGDFNALHQLVCDGGTGSREQTATLGLHLLSRVIHARGGPSQSDEEQIVRQAERRMRDDLGHCPEMTELAKELGVDYDRFRRQFKTLTGLAPKQYYRKLQMRRAEELLLHTKKTVAEIADELGFNSAFHLSAAFKDHSGHAPFHWREQKTASVKNSAE